MAAREQSHLRCAKLEDMLRVSALPLLLSLVACSATDAIGTLGEEPPQDHGRPGFVRTGAKVGSWIGALPGAVCSVVLLPITYPISLLADEPLGMSGKEFLFFPMTGFAAAGHFVIGAPLDSVHWVFYRAWTDQPSPAGYDFVPMSAPVGPFAPESQPSRN